MASGCRRPVRRFERFISFFLFAGMLFVALLLRLFEDVDDEEQADPDDVDEVPVVRDDDGARGLRWPKFLTANTRPMTSRNAIRPPVTCRPWKPVVR